MKERTIKFRSWDGKKMREDAQECVRFDMILKEEKVMQFTGLLDKNGKEIYEGDILDVTEWCNGRAERQNGAVEWGLLSDSDGYSASEYICWKTHGSSLMDTAPLSEVIGNIWENPDLLLSILWGHLELNKEK